jgi:uncharacterized membrane protein
MDAKGLIAFTSRLAPKSRRERVLWSASLALSCTALLLPVLLPLNGNPHADWEQFLGRFHPLAVHLPIGLLVLLPLLEVIGRSRPALREAAGFVLGLSVVFCFGSVALGYLLAFGSGDSGQTVTRHMWGGIALSVFVLLCAFARPSWSSEQVAFVYPALLTGVLLLLTWTADQGGALTHGQNYLTQYMPTALKRISGFGALTSEVAADSFYKQHIDPVFDANCVTCHGEAKAKGGLRLDSYEELMKGGKDGAVILAGHPETSMLLIRVTLPPDHKQFMPAEGKPPLNPEQIGWLRAWIQQGASPTAKKLEGVAIRDVAPDLPIRPVGDYSALMDEIERMEQGQGAKLVPVSSKPSDGLILNTVNVAATFGDAQLDQFRKFAPFIVEAELGRTAVTDGSFATLGTFTNLRALHLEGTAVTGEGIQKLSSLSELSYLNLSGTRLSKAAAAQLDSMKSLRHVYLFNTPAQPESASGLAQSNARNTP